MDLRSALSAFFNIGESIGRWVCVRKYTSEYSEYWKPEYHEAVGGPAYKFIDSIMKTYSIPATRRFQQLGETVNKVGLIELDWVLFFFQYNVDISVNDEIYELNVGGGTVVPELVYNLAEENIQNNKIALKERFKVRRIEDYRDLNGRIEYKLVYAERTATR